MNSRPHVIVVGAGIIGASVAWHLAEGGARVTVLDAQEPGGIATRLSWAWINASFGNPEPLFPPPATGHAGMARVGDGDARGSRRLGGQSVLGPLARRARGLRHGTRRLGLWRAACQPGRGRGNRTAFGLTTGDGHTRGGRGCGGAAGRRAGASRSRPASGRDRNRTQAYSSARPHRQPCDGGRDRQRDIASR